MMVQATTLEQCATCGADTYELCDWCTFTDNVARPICPRHTYTRTPWSGELHTLCGKHERLLRRVRRAYAQDHPQAGRRDWSATQAADYELYFERMS